MLKNISNLGKALNKKEQRSISGGFGGGNCPSVGGICTPGEAVSCIANEELVCVDGAYVPKNANPNPDGDGTSFDPTPIPVTVLR